MIVPLFFATGLNSDIPTAASLEDMAGVPQFWGGSDVGMMMTVDNHRTLGYYGYVSFRGNGSHFIRRDDGTIATRLSVDQIVSAAKVARVSWIVPTVHARNEVDVARVARGLGVPWASVEAVEICADKRRFSDYRRRLGLSSPRSIACDARHEIIEAIQTIGGACILKPHDGYGSLAVRMTNGRDGITSDVNEAVDWHLQRRDAGSQTIVEEFVSGQEYGVVALIENGDVRFFGTTRKEMTGDPYRKECRHIVDPADHRRLRVEPLILDDIAVTARNLHRDTRDDGGLQRAFLNADVLVGPNDEVTVVDMSLRMGGGGLVRLANAWLGVPCRTNLFEMLCFQWAAGLEVDFTPTGVERAAIFGAVLPRGGRLPSLPRSEWADPNVFHVYEGRTGSAQDLAREVTPLTTLASAGDQPMIGADGDTLMAATLSWNKAARSLGVTLA